MTSYQKALSHALLILDQGGPHTKDRIAEITDIAIQTVALSSKGAAMDVDKDRLIRELEAMVAWNVGREFVMDDITGHDDWLPAQRATIEWKFWDRYRRWLGENGDPLPAKAIGSIDKLTDKILERLEDPNRTGGWDRRGMVVGHVQSGKTGNFVGLICKAADAGYRIIVVLAGLNDDLRSQTQLRIDEGFLGYSAARATTFDQGNERIGVGTLVTRHRAVAHSLTGYEQDFSRQRARELGINPGGQDPIILVVKKNLTILTNLLVWLASYRESDTGRLPADIPLLVIDDEADHGSINTKAVPTDPMTGAPVSEYDVTKINAKIRQILSLFSKKAYVGYTATPFANIFIRPDDNSGSGSIGKPPNEIEIPYGEGLFPRSFIISLPTPKNYVGAVKVFGIDSDPEAGIAETVPPLPIIVPVSDSAAYIPPKHKKDFKPVALPESLKKAMRCFVLSCAVRAFRGDDKAHKSMLVHVTRFVSVQEKLKELVEAELSDISNRLRYGDGNSSAQILAELEQLWIENFQPTTAAVKSLVEDPLITETEWNDIKPLVAAAALKISVKQISGESTDVLDYQRSPNGVSVIAIGGDKLSRGLTLYGLSVSYFLRPSRMYDTLMQMGRWFGYRPGYLDVCRLFTTPDLIEWYQNIAFASEELRNEFELMGDRTPKEYGLKVRSDPNGLWITSLVKMRDSQRLRVSYDGQISETTVFQNDGALMRQNLEVTRRLLSSLPPPQSPGNHVWTGVAASEVVGFLKAYKTHPHAPKVNSALLAHYVSKQVAKGYLKNWTVVLVSSGFATATPSNDLGFSVGLIERANLTPSTAKYTIKRLLSPVDEQHGLPEEAVARALDETRIQWAARAPENRSLAEPERPSGPALRKQRPLTDGLLLIYPLDSSKAGGLNYTIPTVGIGISFPGDRLNPTDGVEYEANLVYIGNQLDEEVED
ncbi:Z1 domain-containing protein [Opitutus sp. ER46]|uniref:Z1 domain-containing protein n=1 Tax=Opitutus sp. ER46 TaxID=2161864 RepID=UPI000D2F9A7C|nr:Z1 domain-containing protein [Opitutus sp. ER46]PTX92318.1 endonuclease [Opitutus sp. ER46]